MRNTVSSRCRHPEVVGIVGFPGALRRAELVALDVEHVTWTRGGMKLLIERCGR